MWLPRALLDHLLGEEASRHVVAQAAPWRGPRGEEQRPPDSRQHQLISHVSAPSWKQVCQPQSSLQITVALAAILTATS